MKLHLGKMTGQDIAEWLDISYNGTYRKNPQKFISLLDEYCDYTLVRGGVIINHIYNDTYSKKSKDAFYKVRDRIDEVWDKSGLDSCSRVGAVIYDDLATNDNNFALAESTVYQYTIKGRNELYGKPFITNGKLGSCIYMWCKKESDGHYSLLNEEERKIKDELQTKYFGDATEKQILVKGMIEAGEIKEEEAWGVLEQMTNMGTGNFMGFLSELQHTLGCQVVRGTLVERSAFELEDKGFIF